MFNFLKQKENIVLGSVGILFVLFVWYLVTFLNLINPIFLSSPVDVFKELVSFFKDGSIWSDLLVSANEFIIGFTLALFLGLSLGFILGWYKKVKLASNSLVYALYSTPIIAIIPLIILWFGFGLWPKVIIVFLACFFPILINIMDAVNNTDPQLLKLAKSYRASNVQTIRTIIIPNSVPNIISGIKIAMPRGIIGMIIGEFYTGSVGLGYLITYYSATFQTARLFAIILLIIIISVVFSICIDFFDKKIKYWDK